MTDDKDKALVKQCLEGDLRAFDQLVIKYQKPLYNSCLRMVGDMADAQDIVQTAFIKAFEKLSSFDEKYRFFSWIYRIMVNESLKHLDCSKQAGKLEAEISPDLDTKSPDEQYRVTLLREKIQDALMELKPVHRTVIVLRYFADLSYRELAFVFDLPEKTIKSRLYSARQLLGNIVEAQGITAHD